MSIYYHDHTYEEIAEAAEKNTLIILPVGQIEQHGPHLPVVTDTRIATETARAVAEKIQGDIPVLVMPTVWTAYSVRQVDHWPGLISFREPEPMIQMIYDILASLVKNGFKKIVIINAHGNNPAILELAVRKIGSDYNVFTAITRVLAMSKTIGGKVRKSKEGGCGGHAGEAETALMLYLAPELVKLDRATNKDTIKYHNRFFPGDIYSEIPGQLKLYWSTWGVVRSESGVYGDPTVATAETGRLLFEEIIKNYSEFIPEYYSHEPAEY